MPQIKMSGRAHSRREVEMNRVTVVRGAAGAFLPCALAVMCIAMAVPVAVVAQSGYANAPSREAPIALAQAAALERIEIVARALASTVSSGDQKSEAVGEVEGEGEPDGGLLSDFALVQASLAAAAPKTEQRLAAAIDEMVEASKGGKNAADTAQAVIEATESARSELLPDAVGEPDFRAALIASLLLEEGGVAEGYEEAVEGETSGYTVGWFALQRVKALWGDIAGLATPDQLASVEAVLAIFDRLFPTEARPDHISADPEQAEGPAHMLVGLLEGVANADLYPGRDLAGAAGIVHGIAARGCQRIETGDSGLGVEELRIASAVFGQTVADTLVVMAPEVGETIRQNIEALGQAETPAERCAPLLAALVQGREALAP